MCSSDLLQLCRHNLHPTTTTTAVVYRNDALSVSYCTIHILLVVNHLRGTGGGSRITYRDSSFISLALLRLTLVHLDLKLAIRARHRARSFGLGKDLLHLERQTRPPCRCRLVEERIIHRERR